MDEELQKRGVDLLAQRIDNLVDFFAQKAPSFLVEQVKNGNLVLAKGLPEYLAANYSKCETIRTLLKRDSPTSLELVYQEHRFATDQKIRSEEQVRTSIGQELKPTIISGGAGSGKSVFLKRLFRTSIEHGDTYYPVFFEFRSLAGGPKGNLQDAIYQSMSQFDPSFSRKQFNFGLRSGLFYLMLDALDEAPTEMREALVEEIDFITKKFPKCPLVITSRPSSEFNSWEGFEVAHLQPFTIEQCRSFIEKVDYPKDKKDEFLEFIDDTNFEKHQTFMSNPLLASMMLLTYEEYGDIPERKHVFYDKCFQVLLREHDASKGRYRRHFSSGLNYEQLEEVFTYFCVFSYLEGQFTFERADVEQYISSAMDTTGLSVEVEKLLDDFINAITILQKDGNHFEFTHRSFQEYFYAKFAVKDRDLALVDKINEIRETLMSDGAIKMIADMDKTYFEREFLLPVASKITRSLDDIDHFIAPDRLIGKFWAWVSLRHGDGDDEDSTNKNELRVSYSTSHNETEYPNRKLNLLLLEFCYGYALEIDSIETAAPLSQAELLAIFGLKEPPRNHSEKQFKVNHQNRKKMVELQCGNYANALDTRLRKLVARLEIDVAVRRSRLSEMIKSKRS